MSRDGLLLMCDVTVLAPACYTAACAYRVYRDVAWQRHDQIRYYEQHAFCDVKPSIDRYVFRRKMLPSVLNSRRRQNVGSALPECMAPHRGRH
jgi:hypothetical protein